jgi:antitoxin CptB
MPSPDATQDTPDDPRRRRLLFRAHHRGTKEADLMIGGFVSRTIGTLDAAELDALEALLDLPDVDLADWLSGRLPVPPEHMNPLVERMVRECGASGAGIPEGARRG